MLSVLSDLCHYLKIIMDLAICNLLTELRKNNRMKNRLISSHRNAACLKTHLMKKRGTVLST